MMDVTVSIVHASNLDLTLACLESLEDDPGRRSSVQVVVLDNDSDDGLAEAIRQQLVNVRVMEQPWRAGFGANHNTIIRSTESRYVFILNPDTCVPAGTIDALVAYLDAHSEVAIAGPLLRGFDGRQQFSAFRLMSIPVQLVWALTLGQYGAIVSPGSRPKRVGTVLGCAMLVRREALERVGLFDERYFLYCEEGDLARRLEQLRLERHLVPTVEVLHHGQQSTATVPERRINEFWRSLDLYLAEHHSGVEGRILRWLTGLGYLLAVVPAEVGQRLPQRLRPPTSGSWDAWAHRLHARNAFKGRQGPGLRELAEEWNVAHGRQPVSSPQLAAKRPPRTTNRSDD